MCGRAGGRGNGRMVVVVEVHMAREKCVMYDVRVSQNGK